MLLFDFHYGRWSICFRSTWCILVFRFSDSYHSKLISFLLKQSLRVWFGSLTPDRWSLILFRDYYFDRLRRLCRQTLFLLFRFFIFQSKVGHFFFNVVAVCWILILDISVFARLWCKRILCVQHSLLFLVNNFSLSLFYDKSFSGNLLSEKLTPDFLGVSHLFPLVLHSYDILTVSESQTLSQKSLRMRLELLLTNHITAQDWAGDQSI